MLQRKDGKILLFFIGFLIVYLLPGIYGHTPWKQDENYKRHSPFINPRQLFVVG